MKQVYKPLSKELTVKLEHAIDLINGQCTLIYRFMLETGTPLDAVLKLTKNQLGDFSSVYVHPILQNGKGYYANLSSELSEKLKRECSNKKAQDYVFSISRSFFSKCLYSAVFSVAPNEVNNIAPSSIHKTYFLNFYEYTHDIHSVMRYTGHACPSRAYAFIGIQPDSLQSVPPQLKEEKDQEIIHTASSIIGSLQTLSDNLANQTPTQQYYDTVSNKLKDFQYFLQSMNS